MTTATLQQPSYLSNLGAAALTFVQALFCRPVMRTVATGSTAPASLAPHASERVRQIRELFAMADQADSLAPNLASELRYFAGKL